MNALAPIGDKPARRGPGETADRYPGVVVQINCRWRVILCSAGIQWILQRHDGERRGTARWAGVGYCQTRKALVRLCRASCARIAPSEWAALVALPEYITGCAPDEAKLALIEDPDTVDACASTGGRAIEFVDT